MFFFGGSILWALILKACSKADFFISIIPLLREALGLGAASTNTFSFSKAISYVGYLFYQFPFPGFFLGISGLYYIAAKKRTPFLVMLTIAFATYMLFPIWCNFRDHYQFAISGYVCFSFFITLGVSYFLSIGEKKKKFKRYAILFPCILTLVPFFTYSITAYVSKRFNLDVTKARTLPFRDNDWYFLFPPKNNDHGTYKYGSLIMNLLPLDAVVVGDYTPIMVLKYFQDVEGMRKDVHLILGDVTTQYNAIKMNIDSKPVYAASLEDKAALVTGNLYLSRQHLQGFKVEEAYPAYRILKKN
ncbi:MAG: hypothetical protein WCQ99_13755 [Pseudomonadota bacterium]